MAYFKKADNRGGFGGNNRPPFRPKPHFGNQAHGGAFKKPFGKRFDDNRGDRGERELFSTTCANCGKTCEVPFKPNGRKPVFCNDCFGKDGNRPEQKFEKREFKPRDFSRERAHTPPQENNQLTKVLDEHKKLITELGVKIDGLVKSLDYSISLVRSLEERHAEHTTHVEVAEKTKAAAKKKVSAKKKK